MELKEVIRINDVLGFLVFSKIKCNVDELLNVDILNNLDINNYSFYYFKQHTDGINYTIINIVDIEFTICNNLYKKYIRYKKLTNIL